jgi:serine/threonine-protein kinase
VVGNPPLWSSLGDGSRIDLPEMEGQGMPNANDSGWASTVVVGSLTGIALTADWLPRQVAAHVALDGHTDQFLARDGYLALVIGSTVVATALVTGLLSSVVLRFPDLVNLPNRDFWLAPERREATGAAVSARAVWLGAIVSLFAFGLHLLVLRANRSSPASLDPSSVSAVIVAFLAAAGAWLSNLRRYFGQPGSAVQ